MHGDRISLALSRIEAATRRIKSASRDPSPSPAFVADPGCEMLRQEAKAVLAELDQLIERLEG
jgi:hypothetical protein